MKYRRGWNSFELGIDNRDISEGPSFKRRNIKEDNKKHSENILLEYMFKVQGR
jgi:hypothetical protein